MKGIVMAGGSGTRLHPMTLVVSKQLLPIYDKPLIYYPLSTLMLSGVRKILIISTPQDIPNFQRLLKDGRQWGIQFEYAVQPNPGGLAQAYVIGADFVGNDPSALILGDNIFHGHIDGGGMLENQARNKGASIFAYAVRDPERYGVVDFDAQMKPLSIEEKPKNPKSNYAVTGLYYYDDRAVDMTANLRPSARGELEITDLNQAYLDQGSLSVNILGKGFAWLDTGTPESMVEASEFVRVLEKRQGLKIGCPEEIAFQMGYIDAEQLQKLASELKHSTYGQYLLGLTTR